MESESPLILGIDLGTSSIKVALVSHVPNPKVEICLSRNIGFSTGLISGNIKLSCPPLEHTQDVEKIFHCLHLLLSSLSPPLMSRVTAIAVTGQMHGVVGWLGNGLAFLEKSPTIKKKIDVNVSAGGCGKLITWMDRRCTKEFLDSLPTPSKSQKPFSGYGCATILWHFKNQPEEFSTVPVDAKEELEIFEKVAVLRKTSLGSSIRRPFSVESVDMQNFLITQTKSRSVSQCSFPVLNRPIHHAPWTRVGTVADFLVAALASLKRPIMSPQMAMSWGYFDAENNCWDFSALNASGYNLTHLLPDIVPCGTVVGKLAFDWEGIPAGASVYVALGDLQCSVYPFLERQNEANNVAACNISTSAQIAFKMPSSTSLSYDSESSSGENIFGTLLKSRRIDVWPFFRPGERVVVAASLNGGNIIESFVKMLRFWCRQLGCPAIETAQVYEKLSHTVDDQPDSPLSLAQPISEMVVDPRLFGERYNEISPVEYNEKTNSTGASVTNIHPDDIFSLPAVYSAVCSGVVRNLVSMAPLELLVWANVRKLYCMGGAMKRNPLLLKTLKSEYASADVTCISEDDVIDSCVGAALYTATLI
ncbi:hypothetical protein Aperf_G00000048625 [Anoplocephala perfoliata]